MMPLRSSNFLKRRRANPMGSRSWTLMRNGMQSPRGEEAPVCGGPVAGEWDDPGPAGARRMSVAVASPATTPIAAAPAAAPVLPGLGLVHGQGPAVDLLAAQAGDGRLGLLVGAHLDEAEPLGAACVPVRDHLCRLHRAELTEQHL